MTNMNGTICVGDIRKVEVPYDGETIIRLVIVAGVDEHDGAEVCLIHTYPEYAVGSDYIVSCPAVRYPIVVQSMLRGVMWQADLGELVAHLPITNIRSLDRLPLEDVSISVSSGTPLQGQFDARYPFRASERKELQRICEDATTKRLEEME